MFVDNDERCFLITIGGSSAAPSGFRSVPRRFRVVEVKVFARDLCADFDSRPGPFGHPVRSRSATGPPRAAERSRRIPAGWEAVAQPGCRGAWGGRFRCPSRSNRSFLQLRCTRSRNSTGSLATAPLSASHPLGIRWAALGRCSLAPDRPGQNRHMLRQPTLIRRFLVSGCGWCSCSSLVRRGLRDSPPHGVRWGGSNHPEFSPFRTCKWTPTALLPIPTSRARAPGELSEHHGSSRSTTD